MHRTSRTTTTTPASATRVRRALQAAEHRARPRHSHVHRPRHADAVLQGLGYVVLDRRRTCRPTVRTASRAGVASPPRSDRCSSRLVAVVLDLTPIAPTADDSGLSSSALIAIAVAGAIASARRAGSRQTAKRREREERTHRLSKTELDRDRSLRSGEVLGALGTLAFVLVFNFFLFRVVESNPSRRSTGAGTLPTLNGKSYASVRLDGSELEQFWRYVEQTVQLNLGRSYASNQPVVDGIWAAAPQTVPRGLATILRWCSGSSWGSRRAGGGRRTATAADVRLDDHLVDSSLLAGMILLTFFAVGSASSRPAGSRTRRTAPRARERLDQLWHMTLPCLTLAIAYVGEFALVMRSSILDVMHEDYLTLARAKGSRLQVRDRHAVRNALLPSTALIAINFIRPLGGDRRRDVFSWPGLGLLTYESLRGPDLPMLQGLFLVFSAAVIVFNLVAELAYPFLDPRVRHR